MISSHSTFAPSDSNTRETGGVMAYGGKQTPQSTFSFLLASMSQWIFYQVSPEVHGHLEREREWKGRWWCWCWWGGRLILRPQKIFPCTKHAQTPAAGELAGRWQHSLRISCKQGCVAQRFSPLEADPGTHLALLYDYHKCLDCLHKNVEWRRMPPLPLVAAFYWKGQVCPQGKAKTLAVLHSLSNRLCNQGTELSGWLHWWWGS